MKMREELRIDNVSEERKKLIDKGWSSTKPV